MRGGRYDDGSGISPVLRWDQAGRGKGQVMPASSNTVMDLQALAAGRLLYGAGDPQWGVLEADGRKGVTQTAGIVDHRDSGTDGLRLNASANQFSFRANKETRTFDLNNGQWLKQAKLTPAKTEATAFSVSDWYNTTDPQFNGQPIALEQYERARRLAIAADEQHFVLGTEWLLRYFDQQGKQLWQQAVPDVVWAVNLSRDNRLVVAAFGDGTIRWYRTSDGAEQLAFFPHANGRDWVVWTPEGFYDAGGEGEKLIGYHLNQGADKEGRFVSTAQLGKSFYRQDLIAARLQGDEEKIQQALQETGTVQQVLARGLPPQLELLSPETQTSDNGEVELRFKVHDQGGGIGRIEYRLNGTVVEGVSGRMVGIAVPGRDPLTRRFALPPGQNTLEVVAYDKTGKVMSRGVNSVVQVTQRREAVTLHVLAVGISQYRDRALQLKYAAGDAEAVVRALQQQGQGVFDRVNAPPPLLDRAATLEAIEKAFASISQAVKPQDVFVLYLAGHGMAQNGTYYFFPSELVYNDASSLKQALDEKRLQRLLSGIPASKSLVLLDTCDSGAFKLAGRGVEQKTAIERLMKATGRAVLAAASDSNMALEGVDKHGVFTYALLQGLKKADQNRNQQVEVDELASFVSEAVPEITRKYWQYEQFPQRNLQGQSFPLVKP